MRRRQEARRAGDELAGREISRLADGNTNALRTLAIANALNYPTSTCTPVTADGLRVYPPGETHALFIPTGFTACRNAAVHLLLVTVMRSSFS